jgi:tellurite resistance protein
MTAVSDLEDDDVTPAVPAVVQAMRESLRDIRQRWDALERRDLGGDRERARMAVDVALLIAELNAEAVRALAAMLLNRL